MSDRREGVGYQTVQTDEYGNPVDSSVTRGAYGGDQPQQHRDDQPRTGTRDHDKGMMDKIKEKLPGMDEHGREHDTGRSGYGTGRTDGEKGVMDKVKEKLPGKEEHRRADTGRVGYGTGRTEDNKGVVDKIKEKLPGTGTGTGR